MINDVFQISRGQTDIQGVEDAAHTGHALIKLKVTVVVPHEAADPVASFDAARLHRISHLLGPAPGLLQRLAMGAGCLSRHDFDFRIKFRTPAKYSRHQQRRVLHGHSVFSHQYHSDALQLELAEYMKSGGGFNSWDQSCPVFFSRQTR